MKSIISILCALVFSLFSSVSNCFADEIESELKNDFSNEKISNNIRNNKSDKTDIPEESKQDIFGDEQTFPFVAGLGKNAAH